MGPGAQPAPGRRDAGSAAADHPAVPTGRPAPALPVGPAGPAAAGDDTGRPPDPRAPGDASAGEITGAQAVTIRAGYASRDFVTDPTSGWAVLDQPAVLVCADPVESIRELLPVLEQLIMTKTPLVVVAPRLAAEVLATLEVNQIRRTMRLLAVTPAAADLAGLRRRLRRDDRSTGPIGSRATCRPISWATAERWVSTAKASHLIISAELQHTA